MEFHGIEMEGKLILEKAALPSWTAADEGRIIYDTTNDIMYIGGSSAWIKMADTLLSLSDSPSAYDNGKVLTSTVSGAEWTTPAAGGGSGDLLTIPISGADGEYKGSIKVGTVGETVSAGELLSYDFSDGDYIKSNSSSGASDLMPVRVMACEIIPSGSEGDLLTHGQITNSLWNWSEGDIYADTTNGTVTQIAPSGTGESVQIVGYALTATSIFFDPDKTVIELS